MGRRVQRNAERSDGLRVGEVARRTGLTVRTLHHYESKGLLRAERNPQSGHRLYGREALEQLQRIVALRQLGFSLDEIATALRRTRPLQEVVEVRLRVAREQRRRAEQVCHALERLLERIRAGGEPSADELLHTTEVMVMQQKYFTPEQVQILEERASCLGPAAIKENERQWRELVAELKAQRVRGADPAGPEMQSLAQRSEALVEFITGGDDGLRSGLTALYRGDPDQVTQVFGPDVDRELFALLGKARSILHAGKSPRP